MKKRCALFTLIVIMTVVFVFFSMASFANVNKHEGFTDKTKAAFRISEDDSNPPERFHGTFHQRSEFKGNKEMDILNLSEEQRSEIRQIMLDFQKESLKLRNQIGIKQLEIKGLMLENSVDMDQFKAKLEEISSFQVELKIKAFENQLKIKKVLSEEQLAKIPLGFSIQRSGKRDFPFSLRNKQGR